MWYYDDDCITLMHTQGNHIIMQTNESQRRVDEDSLHTWHKDTKIPMHKNYSAWKM